MTSKIKTLAQGIQTKLQSVNNGGTPAVNYFDHVWVGMPKKIPMGDKCVSMVEVANQPNYYYNTCPTQTQYDVDFIITILVKGHVESSTLYAYEVIEAVQTALIGDQKISNTCIGSTVEEVIYGDLIEEDKQLITGARLTLRCRL